MMTINNRQQTSRTNSPQREPIRLSIIGFGTVGRWLAKAIHEKKGLLATRYGFTATLVSVANARHGFIHREDGLDIPTLLAFVDRNRSLSEYPGAKHWPDAAQGLRATSFDVLAETTGVSLENASVGVDHMRTALERGRSVVTSSKWPVAMAAAELLELARKRNVQFRCESTVMSGTPVLSTLREGMAGARVTALRGVVNGTANFILGEMEGGRTYNEALSEAQKRGYAENNPTDDVDGHDSVAKCLILAEFAFGKTFQTDQVQPRGIAGISREDVQMARDEGMRLKHLVSLSVNGDGRLHASVEPVPVPLNDPLSLLDGTNCGISIDADPLNRVTIIGPGAGKELAGQGIFADLIAVANRKV